MGNSTVILTLSAILILSSNYAQGGFDLGKGIYIKISPPPPPPPLPIQTPQIVKDAGNLISNGSKQIVNGAVSTISQSLEHNSKTVRDVGRISAAIFTAGISEIYIQNKKKETIREQEQILDSFKASLMAEQATNFEDQKSKVRAGYESLIKLQTDLLNNYIQESTDLAELKNLLNQEVSYRSSYPDVQVDNNLYSQYADAVDKVTVALQTHNLAKVNDDLIEIFKLKQAELQVEQSAVLAGILVNIKTESLNQWIALVDMRLIYLQNEELVVRTNIVNTTTKLTNI